MSKKFHITISEDNCQPLDSFDTEAYILIRMENGVFKVTGNINPSSLAPLLLKLMAEKMSK